MKTMAATSASNKKALISCLRQTLHPNHAERREAEKSIAAFEQLPGHCMLVLETIEGGNNDPDLQLIAAVYFKNVVRKYWAEENSVLGKSDREAIKANLLTLMCHVGQRARPTLSEAVRIIGRHDFPDEWQGLLPDLVAKLGSATEFGVILGLLETANTLLNVFQEEHDSDDLRIKLKTCLDALSGPVLKYLELCMKMLEETPRNEKAKLKDIFQALRLLLQIIYSLNFIDLPEFFEDNMPAFMGRYLLILQHENPALRSEDDEIPGCIERAQVAVLTLVQLYTYKYEEDVRSYVAELTQATWRLLISADARVGNDELVVVAMKLLCQLVANPRFAPIFKDFLHDIALKIVTPNMRLRETDIENFADNPMDYIRADIEGSDTDTRRRTARDLVRAMLKQFSAPTTRIFTEIIQKLMGEFEANRSGNWLQFDCAISVLIAVSVRLYTLQGGVTGLNEGVAIHTFFSSFVVPVLSDSNVDTQAVVKADVIKFFSTFRNQIPRNIVIEMLPHLVRLLGAASFVVHTYAASCIERIFMIQEPIPPNSPPNTQRPFRFGSSDLALILEPVTLKLFDILEKTEAGATNEYVAKALMRVLSKAEPQHLAPAAAPVLGKLSVVLARVIANPTNPSFIHYLFESIAILIKSTCKVQPNSIEQFEAQLMPSFQHVLQNEIDELTAYVFQLLAMILELRPSGVSQGYLSLFKPLLTPQLWQNRGNIPGLLRLVEAYLRKAAAETVGSDPSLLEGVFGIFQHLLSVKATAPMSFGLLCGIVEFLPATVYGPYLEKIVMMTLTRLSSYQNKQLGTAVTRFFSVLVGKHGAASLVSAFDTCQPNLPSTTLFAQVLDQIWIPSSRHFRSTIDRKACVVALTRVVAEVVQLRESTSGNFCSTWANALVATLHVLEMSPEDEDLKSGEELLAELEEGGYSSSFSRLAYAQTEIRDCFREVESPKQYFISALSDAAVAHPGTIMPLMEDALRDKPGCQDAIKQYYKQYGKTIA